MFATQQFMFDFIFVVLVYRNSDDLEDFFSSFTIPNSKVIVVNSFYDQQSEARFRTIAHHYNADFISVENKGYGAGNNAGIDFALQHYQFKYLIISNADINIMSMSISNLSDNIITAPKIISNSRHNQNPHTPYYSKMLEKLKKHAFERDNKSILKLALGVNSMLRRLFRIGYKLFNLSTIHAPHGSFIIFPYNILEKLVPLFNPKMFLFAEEDHLAMKALKNRIPCRYNPSIKVFHKEDGSTGSLPKGSQYQITKNSFLEYYKCWHSRN